jgi:hypothetical protein
MFPAYTISHITMWPHLLVFSMMQGWDGGLRESAPRVAIARSCMLSTDLQTGAALKVLNGGLDWESIAGNRRVSIGSVCVFWMWTLLIYCPRRRFITSVFNTLARLRGTAGIFIVHLVMREEKSGHRSANHSRLRGKGSRTVL